MKNTHSYAHTGSSEIKLEKYEGFILNCPVFFFAPLRFVHELRQSYIDINARTV